MSAVSIGVVDYGMGNRRSVEKALERVGARPRLTGDHDALRAVDGLVVPGVGAFPEAMRRLALTGLDGLIAERSAAGTPVLGICLGMQLLFDSSLELGGAAGLGLLAGAVTPLDPRGAKLPHIGWNQVHWRRSSPLTAGLADPCAFYHVHSYVVRADDQSDVIGESEYGEPFASVVGRDPVYGAQFHPEKSSAAGLRLLSNFAAICARIAA